MNYVSDVVVDCQSKSRSKLTCTQQAIRNPWTCLCICPIWNNKFEVLVIVCDEELVFLVYFNFQRVVNRNHLNSHVRSLLSALNRKLVTRSTTTVKRATDVRWAQIEDTGMTKIINVTVCKKKKWNKRTVHLMLDNSWIKQLKTIGRRMCREGIPNFSFRMIELPLWRNRGFVVWIRR